MPGGINPPPSQWLTWPRPNYVDPPTKPKYLLTLSCVLGPLSTVLLLVRLWVRTRIQRNAGLDDWIMLASWFPIITLSIIFPLVTEKYYFNRHIWDVEFHYFPIQRQYVMAIYALFTLAAGLLKVAVLLFYRRLASRAVSPFFRWTLRITVGVIGVYTIIFFFVTCFMCAPVSAFWDQLDVRLILKGDYTYKCASEGAEIVANGVISTIQDFITASLPAVLCWNLKMPARQKLALYSVFAMSYGAVVMGAFRTYTSYRLFFETYDTTWNACDVWLWSLLELHVGFICANAPALRALYVHHAKSPRSPHSSSPRSMTNSSLRTRPSLWHQLVDCESSGYLSGSHSHVTSKDGATVEMKAYSDSMQTIVERDTRFASKSDSVMGRIVSFTNISIIGSEAASSLSSH